MPTQEDRIAALVGLGSCPPNERLRIGATIPMKICQQRKLQVDEWIMKIGGGLNFKRKQFLSLLDAILAEQIERVVLAHQDRLARFGYHLLVHLCQTHQCELLVMNTQGLGPEQELVQDLLTITHGFSRRLSALFNGRWYENQRPLTHQLKKVRRLNKDDLTLADLVFVCPEPDCGYVGDRSDQSVNSVKDRLDRLETQSTEHTALLSEHTGRFDHVEALLTHILARLPEKS